MIATDDGKQLKAAFSVERDGAAWLVRLNARGGTAGSPSELNPDYIPAVEVLLRRLAALDAVLLEAAVDSIPARKLPAEQRRIAIDGWSYPVRLSVVADLAAFGDAVRRGQKPIAREPNPKRPNSGNETKKLLLRVTLPDKPESWPLAEYLRDGRVEVADGRGPRGWWSGRPEERYWMEITNRPDIGRNLNAPLLDKNGEAYWGYEFVEAVKPGDVVFHYDTTKSAIVGYSFAVGSSWRDDVVWAARGTASRKAGIEPHLQPGRYLGLEGFTALNPVLPLAELIERREQVLGLRDRLEARYKGQTLAFPVIPYRDGLRAFQGYLAKFPAELVAMFPRLVPPDVAKTDSNASVGFGGAYRTAAEDASVAGRDPFSVDPALVERGIRGHAATQNKVAEFGASMGLEVSSPSAGDPNFDVALSSDTCIYVVEVKSITDENEEKQLRLGLGQVLRYAHVLRGRTSREVVAVLALERAPTDTSWRDLCAELGVRLVWPEVLSALLERPLPREKALALA